MIPRTLVCFAFAVGMAIAAPVSFAQQAPSADSSAAKAAAKGARPKGGAQPQPIRGTFPGPSGQAPVKLDPRATGKR